VGGGGGERGSDITIFFHPNVAFHFFTTITLIYFLVYQSSSLSPTDRKIKKKLIAVIW
jgi:hypothetical protein